MSKARFDRTSPLWKSADHVTSPDGSRATALNITASSVVDRYIPTVIDIPVDEYLAGVACVPVVTGAVSFNRNKVPQPLRETSIIGEERQAVEAEGFTVET